MGGGSLSIWGGAGWSHCLQMSPPPSAWPDPAPTWPVATQRPPANIHLFLQGTQTPQVTHAPRGQRKQGSRVPQAPWATPGGVERGTHCPHPELTARNPAGVPTGWQWPCRGGELCGETAHRGPYPPTTGGLSGPSTQKSPRRGRGYEAHRTPRLPAPLPGSLLMLGASVGGRCPSSPSLTRGPELPPWRWASISARSTVPGPQAARTGRRGRNGPSLPC